MQEKLKLLIMRRGVQMLLLGAVVAFALMVRLYFFTGITYAMEQDEGIYLSVVHQVFNGDFRVSFAGKPADYIPDPAEAFQFRYALLYIPVFLYRAFGVSDFTTVLFPLACSLGTVALAFYAGRLFLGPSAGLVSALLCAVYPLDVLFSTRLMPDGPMAFFFWLSLYLFVRAGRCENATRRGMNHKSLLYLLSGLSIGACYTIKLSVVFIAALLAMYMLFYRRMERRQLMVLVGFSLILGAEGACFLWQGDDFFLNFRMNARIYRGKFLNEAPDVLALIPGYFNYWYVDTMPLYYAKTILRSLQSLKENLFGYFWAASIMALLAVVVRREKRLYLLAAWFVALYLLHEFSPVRVALNTNGALFNYYLLSQRARYLTVMALPSAVLTAYFLLQFRKAWLACILYAALAATSLIAINDYCMYWRSGVTAINQACDYLQQLPRKTIYTDFLGVHHMQYHFGFERDEEIKNIAEERAPISDAYVVLGGSRGMDVAPMAMQQLREQGMKKKEPCWRLLKTIANPAHPVYGKYFDLVIYQVPKLPPAHSIPEPSPRP
jgi:hypothetical protein